MEQGRLELPGPLLARAEALGLEFLVEVYASEVARKPGNVEALSELGHLYTRLGRHAEGLAVDRQVVRLMPEDATAHYNLACSLALTGAADEAFAELELAVELGYDDPDHLAADEDFASLRSDARFAALLERLRSPGAG
jgi:Flp pilus assembly protein TadD